jgi:hypothetical protein
MAGQNDKKKRPSGNGGRSIEQQSSENNRTCGNGALFVR